MVSSFRILAVSWNVPCEPASSITKGIEECPCSSVHATRRLVIVIDSGLAGEVLGE